MSDRSFHKVREGEWVSPSGWVIRSTVHAGYMGWRSDGQQAFTAVGSLDRAITRALQLQVEQEVTIERYEDE